MATPTPGSDPNHPQGGAAQGRPDWGAPPPQGYDPAPSWSGSPADSVPPAGRRPGMVTAAAVMGVVWGGLGALFSLVILLGAFAVGAALGGLIFLVALALYVALLVGGIFVLTGRPPRVLLYAGYAGVAIGLLALVVSLVTVGGNGFSGVLGILIAGVIVGLLLQPQARQYFAARGQSY
jgi:hypothetical protein